ncbi:MAG: rod shape-determining protein MreC [Chitinophagaceae bacterium]|nr:rod shape-determining protein MreC [Chitinophagaceae bacterium]
MRNIFLFIRRYFNLLFFIFLQGISIYLIVHYSRYHKAMFGNFMNQVTGKVNEQYSQVDHYFRLKKTNDSLMAANEKLYNKLRSDFDLPDTTSRSVIDTIRVDSLEQFRKYQYLKAKVVANSVVSQNNFIVIGRGSSGQLKEGMGVIDPNNGVVGIITDLSKDYAVVMSLLHTDSHISGKLLHGGETGTLSWDGKTPNIISLTGIPKSAKVARGDTIITSGFSTSFPRGKMIGIVEEVIPEKSTNNFRIKFKSTANFYNLDFVFVIDNRQAEPIGKLLDQVKKQGQ